MRTLYTIILLFVSTSCFSQITTNGSIPIDSGKNDFKLQAQSQTPDYSNAYKILTNQVKQNPNNAELRYFLGYTIDRMNADDGKSMFQVKKEMSIEASEQFEEVNRLEPIYKGEQYILDPYAKITSIWGSLAEAYLNKNLPDSAKWAFAEGKRRGGFIEPILEFNRQLLNGCETNSILITYGDDITIPIWYLQAVENFRNDITVVDANLINTSWYPEYLKNQRKLKMNLSDAEIDTVDYMAWESKNIEIINPKDSTKKLIWDLRPTYMDAYILKGDIILLDILEQNFFTRPIYFNAGSDSSYNLFLTDYLIEEGLVSKIDEQAFNYLKDTFMISNNFSFYSIKDINAEDISKSKDAVATLNGFRSAYGKSIYYLILQGRMEEAKELLKQMTEKFSKDKLPFVSDEDEKSYADFFKQVDKNYR
jgi:hypothetical protein